ncbi:hypothetical protein HMPREF9446_02253 [Bacteroides fluxus YIT 12057]|uniref:Uncharacterized protein n=1 Tax=Bacteroides fluxus YIT 12057 TaxID=763034 RepID=F3PU33_9BACE|nr:hypothetical protein HMPREF9446_02253 [Bacteroides fluxus YIT 12057]
MTAKPAKTLLFITIKRISLSSGIPYSHPLSSHARTCRMPFP